MRKVEAPWRNFLQRDFSKQPWDVDQVDALLTAAHRQRTTIMQSLRTANTLRRCIECATDEAKADLIQKKGVGYALLTLASGDDGTASGGRVLEHVVLGAAHLLRGDHAGLLVLDTQWLRLVNRALRDPRTVVVQAAAQWIRCATELDGRGDVIALDDELFATVLECVLSAPSTGDPVLFDLLGGVVNLSASPKVTFLIARSTLLVQWLYQVALVCIRGAGATTSPVTVQVVASALHALSNLMAFPQNRDELRDTGADKLIDVMQAACDSTVPEWAEAGLVLSNLYHEGLENALHAHVAVDLAQGVAYSRRYRGKHGLP